MSALMRSVPGAVGAFGRTWDRRHELGSAGLECQEPTGASTSVTPIASQEITISTRRFF
jgi:hypothetical protein